MSIFDTLQSNGFQSAGRNIVSAVLGAAGMLGMLTLTQQHDLIQAWGDIQSGVAQAAKGMAVFAGVLGPIALAVWAKWTTQPKQMVAAVKEIAKDPTSPVAGIITTDNAAGRELANSMNSAVVAPAGTISASLISKS